jgi:hypothetical protein
MKCMHGISINLPCDGCKTAMTLPDDGWYRVICFSPDGVAADQYQRLPFTDAEAKP